MGEVMTVDPKKYLFINTSANRDGKTAELGTALLEDLPSERIDLIDYRIGFFGQEFADDEYEAVFEKVMASDVVVLGSPVYTDNMSAAARAFLERLECHPRAKELAGRAIAFIIQGYQVGPTLLEAAVNTVKNAAEPQGMTYLGVASDMVELAELREKFDA
ncbi:MAG: NAD(P)H-dependent oxidoreductase [Actinomycetaceae bacterium]|nr:NAD(P)H-dependent oxidoreductase [Actinomycetaceae bacterium]